MRIFFLLFLAACSDGKIAIGDSVQTNGDDSGPLDSQLTDSEDSVPVVDTAPDVLQPLPDLLVDCHGDGDTESIQAAIDQAASPARIAVAPCTYYERPDFLGKIIDLYSLAGSEETIIDGQQGGTVIDLETFEAGWSRVAGFTITGGYDEADGAAMELTRSSVELQDIIFTGNTGLSLVRSAGASVDMVNVQFYGNTVLEGGQAIRMDDGGNLNMDESQVNCDGGTQAIWHHIQLLVTDSDIRCETGYGIWDYHGEDYILRSTIYGGLAGFHAADTESTPEEPDSPSEQFKIENSVIGGGVNGAEVLYMHLELVNSVFYGTTTALSMTACDGGSSSLNNVFIGGACGITGDQRFTDSYSAFWGNTENGCGVVVNPSVSSDPLFVDFPDDVHLQLNSPLIDAGSSQLRDGDGSRSDIGRYGGPLGDW